jgi:hypothetical protein
VRAVIPLLKSGLKTGSMKVGRTLVKEAAGMMDTYAQKQLLKKAAKNASNLTDAMVESTPNALDKLAGRGGGYKSIRGKRKATQSKKSKSPARKKPKKAPAGKKKQKKRTGAKGKPKARKTAVKRKRSTVKYAKKPKTFDFFTAHNTTP